MIDIVMKNMINTVECKDNGCVSPLFGFAVNDYKAKYNLTNDDLMDKKIFGGIIYTNETTKDVASILELCVEANYDMIIIDINAATESHICAINTFFDLFDDYEELKDVYQDRMVFVKISK